MKRIFLGVCLLGALGQDIKVGTAEESRMAAVAEYKNEDEEAKAYGVTRTVKKVSGLNFLVETDMPIEKIAGVYRPIDIDSYVALKFKKLDQKIEQTAASLQQKIDDLSQKVEALTKQVEKLTALQSAQSAPPEEQSVSAPRS